MLIPFRFDLSLALHSLVCASLLLVNEARSAAAQCSYPTAWQSELSVLMHPNSLPQFQTAIVPFANLATATYTADPVSIPNYTEIARHENDLGLHWIAIHHDTQSKVILGIRGTDLNSQSASGQADDCADWYLWHPWDERPSYCKQFNASTLAYLDNAIAVAKQLQQAYPTSSLAVTGHSLGAGIAQLVRSTCRRRTTSFQL
eukprot:TRINITY_DN7450_c0_g1_i1.p2 TRINITY_DN7450_c0_g1~~TRINITY_DN7450_c0_g1_i1.p2  ORF type:complete len:202 (+),score=24.18 TRINITY_DN7450_c0_g1_i1:1-606(+)